MKERNCKLATAAIWLIVMLLITAGILLSFTWHKGRVQSEAKLVQLETEEAGQSDKEL